MNRRPKAEHANLNTVSREETAETNQAGPDNQYRQTENKGRKWKAEQDAYRKDFKIKQEMGNQSSVKH